jgi:CIC family chloride channel protein
MFSFWLPPHMRFLLLFGDGLHHELDSLLGLAPMAILAFVLVAVAVLYIKIFYGIHGLAKSIPLPPFMRPVVGAVAAGLLGLGLYYAWNQNRHVLAVLGTGYGALQEALADPSAVGMELLLCIAFFKTLTTSATIAWGYCTFWLIAKRGRRESRAATRRAALIPREVDARSRRSTARVCEEQGRLHKRR